MYVFLPHRISSYSFRGNYFFLNLEIVAIFQFLKKETEFWAAETIQEQKLYEEIRYVCLRTKSRGVDSFLNPGGLAVV